MQKKNREKYSRKYSSPLFSRASRTQQPSLPSKFSIVVTSGDTMLLYKNIFVLSITQDERMIIMLKKPLKKNNDTNTINKISIEEEVEEMVEDTVDEFDDFEEIEDDETEADDYSGDFEFEEDAEEESTDEDDSVDEEEDEKIEDEETDEKNSILIVEKKLAYSNIREGYYNALLTEVVGERKLTGKYGPWINIGFKFKMKNPDTGEYIEITFNANKSLDPKSRLYPIVKGILGAEPGDNFNLRELEGKKARVSIEQSTDAEGNVWDNIVAARKYVPKKK